MNYDCEAYYYDTRKQVWQMRMWESWGDGARDSAIPPRTPA